MGFFDRMFGSRGGDDKAAVEPQATDFVTALALQVRSETDAALSAYLKISAENPMDILAPFFASTVVAYKGNCAEAAASLRDLSSRIAAGGQSISRSISLELVAQVKDAETLSVPAIAEIVVCFGDALKSNGYLRESAVCFEIAAALVPDNAHLLHKFGDTLHDLRMYDYAETMLQEALKYAPNHWGALYTYAVLLQDLGRVSEAIEYYEKAIQLNPHHAKCQNNLGAALLTANRLDEALEHCNLAAGLDPGSPLAQANLGNIYMVKQEYDQARGCFKKAISLDENLPPAYFGLGLVELMTGNRAGSRELLMKAVALNPSAPEFHHALGKLLADEGNQDALSHFAAAAQLNNNLRDLHRDFGTACLKLGRREEGLEHLKIALQQNPDDALAREILAGGGLQ